MTAAGRVFVDSKINMEYAPFETQASFYQNSWLTLSAGHVLDSRPPVEDHGGVVVNMKESHLAVLLPQDEEKLLITEERRRPSHFGVLAVIPPILSYWTFFMRTHRVAELYHLGEEKPPADSCHLEEENHEFDIFYCTFYF